jgi:DNA uptake protein ComE-like DNA-binding protein
LILPFHQTRRQKLSSNRQNNKELSKMKVLSFLGAVGLGIFSGAWILAARRRRESIRTSSVNKPTININEASQQELMQSLGLDADLAERIVEQRPYPSKIDLLGRMVVPEEIYNSIKHRISYKAS